MSYLQKIEADGAEYLIALPHKNTDYIQRHISESSVPYEVGMLRDMAQRLSSDELVLDVGANIGNHSLYLAAVVGSHVHAFEPNGALCEALKMSVCQNNLESKIVVHCVGVGKESGKAHFDHIDESNLGAQSLAIGNGECDTIDVISLDGLDFKQRVAAIKLDVEGMEFDVLEGAFELVHRDKPLLYIECQSVHHFNAIQTLLSRYGYVYRDTFNATPTHLFIHRSKFLVGEDSEQLLLDTVRKQYDLQLQLRELQSSLHMANSKYRQGNEQIGVLKDLLMVANGKYHDATEQVETYKEKWIQANKKYRDMNDGVELYRQRWTDANDKYRSICEQLVECKEKWREANDLYRSVSQKLLDYKEKCNETNCKYRLVSEQVAGYKEKSREITEKFSSVNKQLVEYKEKCSEANERYRLVSEQVTDYKERANEATKMYSSVSKQLVEHKKKWSEANDKYRSTSDQLMEYKEKCSEANERNRLVSEQVENYKDRLSEANDNYRAAQEKLSTYIEVLNQEKAQHAAAKQQIALFMEQLEKITEKYDIASKKIESLQGNLKDLVQSSERQQTKIHRIENKLAQAQREEARLKGEKRNLLAQLTAANEKYRLATRQLDAIRSSKAFNVAQYLKRGAQILRRAKRAPGKLLRVAKSASGLNRTKFIFSSHSALSSNYGTKYSAPSPEAINRPKHASLRDLRVACVMDDFTFSSYLHECDLYALTPRNWKSELDECLPHILFIESAWRGKDELWGSKVGHTSLELQGIVQWCRDNHVPTVFWNKEDPVHFETFLNTARLFDFIFTTDVDCIHRYKAALQHERVYFLPFACQPRVNNPLEKYERKDAFCFAGAYYVRYPERTRDLSNFVEHISEYRSLEIYDRNYGKDHPNYRFPESFQPYIVGSLPFEQIDRAYKGYRFGINLNSIKQSQTMFARRVYELLASNTVTVSNYSRGVRLMFGDLVVTSDDGGEIIRSVKSLAGDDLNFRKFRLAGLRKIMREHTYQDRLAYILAKIKGEHAPDLLPTILMVGYAKNHKELEALRAQFEYQCYSNKRLLVVSGKHLKESEVVGKERIYVVSAKDAKNQELKDWVHDKGWVAGILSDDYYGRNYLTDLALATRYSDADAIGKKARYEWEAPYVKLTDAEAEYRAVKGLQLRAAIIRGEHIVEQSLYDFAVGLQSNLLQNVRALAIDRFNYCQRGNIKRADRAAIESVVGDRPGISEGVSLSELIARAEGIKPECAVADQVPMLSGEQLSTYFKPSNNKEYRLKVSGTRWEVESSLEDGKHDYLYAAHDVTPGELGFDACVSFFLDVTPGLNLQMVVMFLDKAKQRISAEVRIANRNHEISIPAGTEYVRLGLRFYSGGAAAINGLLLGHRRMPPAEVMGRSNYLLLTNHYPSYDDLYRNGFVHSRVKSYKERGVCLDVFRFRKDEPLSYHEFQDVDVITGSQGALQTLLNGGQYRHVLVHFLDMEMWAVLKEFIGNIKVTVWLHGAEIHPWYRRKFDIVTPLQEQKAREQSEQRMAFWRQLLVDMPANLNLVFVSNSFAEEVMEDLGFRLPEEHYSVIHNPIDTELFRYVPKCAEQRRKILSIRPFASRIYANDLTVEVILLLSKRPFFDDLEFRIVGDGRLFEETIAPLRGLSNVIIEQRFLTREDIAELHAQYGIFLCPSRTDSQGVSRDEAMSSGLVPITNGVSAIPEFVDQECGVLASPEDAQAMADGISFFMENPQAFVEMSNSAAARVRRQTSKALVIDQELGQFVSVRHSLIEKSSLAEEV